MPFLFQLRLVWAAVIVLCLGGCNPFGTSEFTVEGRVVGFGSDGRTVIVEHGDVPGLMPAMTMPFEALDSTEVKDLAYGDAVRFTLSVSRERSWIHDVQLLPADALPPLQRSVPAGAEAASGEPILQPGDALPDFELVDHEGQPLGKADYAGEALLVTFIYTRCPLPEFCPLLSRRFAELQPVLQERYGDAVRLLSITIDPEHDTPEVLASYAARYSRDLTTWRFATGNPEDVGRVAHWFGMYYAPNGPEIDHSLATALIRPDGIVANIWRGTQWTPEEVLRAVSAAVPGHTGSPE